MWIIHIYCHLWSFSMCLMLSLICCWQLKVHKGLVPDYNDFVKEADEMWLDKISRKINGLKYRSAEEFRQDIICLKTNAVAYNTPGNGAHGVEGEEMELTNMEVDHDPVGRWQIHWLLSRFCECDFLQGCKVLEHCCIGTVHIPQSWCDAADRLSLPSYRWLWKSGSQNVPETLWASALPA